MDYATGKAYTNPLPYNESYFIDYWLLNLDVLHPTTFQGWSDNSIKPFIKKKWKQKNKNKKKPVYPISPYFVIKMKPKIITLSKQYTLILIYMAPFQISL